MLTAYLIPRLKAYVIILPRWFALPGALASIVLGGVLTGQGPSTITLACLAGSWMVGYAHTWNSFQDWVSGFDQGTVSERSHEKPYTGGQNLIAKGEVTVREVFSVALAYLVASAVVTAFLATATTQWVWLPWGLVAACAPLYSFGKRTFTCELWLALGFGPLAVMFGAAVGPGPEMARAFLAGIPFGLVFGFMAETVDQYLDADVNIPKGLRNLGALCWRRGWGLGTPLFLMAMVTLGVHGTLIGIRVLSIPTLFAAPILVAIAIPYNTYENKDKRGIMAGLALVMLYPLAILVVEALT